MPGEEPREYGQMVFPQGVGGGSPLDPEIILINSKID